MIQRIQTIHLLFAAGLAGLFLGLGGGWAALATDVAPWLVGLGYGLAGLTAAAALVAVFLYKNRPTQRQAVRVAMVLDLLLVVTAVGAVVARAVGGEGELSSAEIASASVALLPVFAYVFLGLASQGVRRDIELIRSVDRLR